MINPTYSQENFGGGTDDLPVNFGFVFQSISSDCKIIKKDTWRAPFIDPTTGAVITPALNAISSPSVPSFGVGFVTNITLNEHFDLRFIPGFVFADNMLGYEYMRPEDFAERKISLSLLNFPLGIRLKSDRRKNFRAYLFAGVRYSLDLLAKSKISEDIDKAAIDKMVKNKVGMLWYEAAIGCQFYFEYFKISPELKFSHTIDNVLYPEDHPYSSPIDKLFIRNIQLSIYLE